MPEEIFEDTIQKTNKLLNDIQKEVGWLTSRKKTYSALRAVLQTLRDRLTVDEAVDLGAQLPMFVRGFYYEGWDPSKVPVKMNRAEFIGEIERVFPSDPEYSTEEMIRKIFLVLRKHISSGEMEEIKHVLPQEFRELFP